MTLDVPETLHALVAARLDGLPDDERSLVQDASVAGHSFTLDAVCAVSGRTPDDVEPRLRALVRKEILDQDVDPRSAERGQYRFVQSVIQEVAYSTLTKASRRAKHLACAHWFESSARTSSPASSPATTWTPTAPSPPLPTPRTWRVQAREWLRVAAARAFSLGSPETAFDYAVQALTLAATPEERAALLQPPRQGARYTGRLELAWEHYAAASDAYQLVDDPHTRV